MGTWDSNSGPCVYRARALTPRAVSLTLSLKLYVAAGAVEKWAPQSPRKQLKGGAWEEPTPCRCRLLTGADVVVSEELGFQP